MKKLLGINVIFIGMLFAGLLVSQAALATEPLPTTTSDSGVWESMKSPLPIQTFCLDKDSKGNTVAVYAGVGSEDEMTGALMKGIKTDTGWQWTDISLPNKGLPLSICVGKENGKMVVYAGYMDDSFKGEVYKNIGGLPGNWTDLKLLDAGVSPGPIRAICLQKDTEGNTVAIYAGTGAGNAPLFMASGKLYRNKQGTVGAWTQINVSDKDPSCLSIDALCYKNDTVYLGGVFQVRATDPINDTTIPIVFTYDVNTKKWIDTQLPYYNDIIVAQFFGMCTATTSKSTPFYAATGMFDGVPDNGAGGLWIYNNTNWVEDSAKRWPFPPTKPHNVTAVCTNEDGTILCAGVTYFNSPQFGFFYYKDLTSSSDSDNWNYIPLPDNSVVNYACMGKENDNTVVYVAASRSGLWERGM